jgi:putative NIF3 family GTP cyclohydrolase 1 type 2
MSLKKILYTIFDPNLLDSEPDEWGVVNHCPNPNAIGYATTLTPSVIRQSVAVDIDLLVTHHDSWDFMFEEREVSLHLLEKHQISHVWSHIPLDCADFGTASALLTSIGCKIVAIIVENCGRIGELPCKHDLPEVIGLFSEQLGETPCRVHDANRDIQRVAAVPGGGNMTNYLKEAHNNEADLYVTGETSLYLLEYSKHLGINTLVYSHNYTENFGTRNMALKFAEQLNIPRIVRLDEPHF